MIRSTKPALGRIAIDARAKLNLTLAVGPLRADGFHDLVTVFQSVSLADTLILEPRRRGFSLVVKHESANLRGPVETSARHGDEVSVPAGEDNLVLRAAHRVAAELGLSAGARCTLIKRIPVGAGMGGGSADAAAVIAALPALYGMRLAPAQRRAIALELGSDVPFALTGGTALGRGRGEALEKIAIRENFRAVIAVPAWRISTARAFARIDHGKYGLTARGLNLRSAQILGREQLSVTSLMRLGNTFEKVLGDRRSDFVSLGARLRRADIVAVRMTGSGSAVFAVLGPVTSFAEVAGRFTGGETLYAVRSARSGLRRHDAVT